MRSAVAVLGGLLVFSMAEMLIWGQAPFFNIRLFRGLAPFQHQAVPDSTKC